MIPVKDLSTYFHLENQEKKTCHLTGNIHLFAHGCNFPVFTEKFTAVTE